MRLARGLEVWRLLRFGLVGASGALVNLSVLWFAREHLLATIGSPSLRLNGALALAIPIATLNNYFWNRFWTWNDRRATGSSRRAAAEFAQYVLAVAVGSAVQVALTNLLAAWLQYLVANGIAISVAAAVNFALNDAWTFRAGPAQSQRK